MDNNNHKKYTIQAKRWVKGEAFFESLVSDYCIPHHIVAPKDLGIDYICEWVYDDRPTGVLFAVQIKTFSEKTSNPVKKGIDKGNSQLEKYEIKNINFKIDERTLSYWKGLSIPVYLFVICLRNKGNLDCFYKRFTLSLTSEVSENFDFYSDFLKVNENNIFLAFSDLNLRIGGFARDLLIDYMRCNYNKGSIAYLNPRIIGLNQFPEEHRFFRELVDDYEDQLRETCNKMKFLCEYLNSKKTK